MERLAGEVEQQLAALVLEDRPQLHKLRDDLRQVDPRLREVLTEIAPPDPERSFDASIATTRG